MCSVNQHLCRRRQMCRKLSQIHPVHSLLFDTKKDLSWVNYLVMARFQLICLFSGDKNKVQMCSVTQHQYRCRQICRKLSPIHPVHSFLSVTKNDLSWLNNLLLATFNSLRFPLMLRTNYWCVKSINISVGVAKCVENFYKFT